MFLVDASKNLNGFSIDLIPRHSPMSPLYDSLMTQTELVKSAAIRSIARSKRVDFIGQNELLSPSPSSSIESPITHVSDHGEYLMRFSLGTPSVERLAIFDTGSDLSWVQCSPCKACYPQDAPLFDPTQSSTYMDAPCDSQPCTLIPQSQRDCGNSRQCIYLHQYSENSITIGKLGHDTIRFCSTGMGQCATFPKTAFGCGVYNNFTFQLSSKANGFVGLGPGPLSLASQLGGQISHKFSYCMVPFSSTSTGKLIFGNQTMAPSTGVVSTPFIINPSLPSYYFLNLEGITIGQKKVLTGQTGGNIIIDSVPILTHLEQSLYADFISSVKEAINVEAAEDAPTPFEYCVRNPTNMIFPDFVFHFTGADVVLNPSNMFISMGNNLVCMTVLPSRGISIFGNWAQVNFQVEYDLGERKVSFAPTNCSTY
uniref:Aspartic proteinase nepenthesin-1 n=2 Tax=Cajanus cajan TaxID=3821 RepID=A0A151QRC9_CAJCA|nr:Aspartic proteinase nepenthesin-1 [Cajanus cajan]